MFMSFIAGLIFGVGSGYFEKMIAGPLRQKLSLSDSELSIVSFAALMLIASIVISAMGVNTSSFWMVLGGAIGAFGIRAYAFGKGQLDERRLASQSATDATEDAVAAAEDLAESAKETVSDAASSAKDAVEDVVDAAKKSA